MFKACPIYKKIFGKIFVYNFRTPYIQKIFLGKFWLKKKDLN